MEIENIPLLILLAMTGAMAVFFSVLFWSRRADTAGGISLTIVTAGVTFWAWGTAFVLINPPPAILISGNAMILGATAVVPVAFFRFTLSLTGRSGKLSDPVSCALLLAIPVTMGIILFLATDPLPFLPSLSGILPSLALWISTIYALGLALVGLTLIVQLYQSAPGIFRDQLICLLIACGTPVALHVIYLFRIGLSGIIDPAPVGCIISFIAIGIGMRRYYLFDVVPVENGDVLRQAGSGIVVLDPKGRITGVNMSACQMLGILSPDVIGEPVIQYLASPDVPDLSEYPAGKRKNLIRKKLDDSLCYIEIRCVPLLSGDGRNRGRIMMLSNVTDRILIQQSLNMARRNINLLTSITRHDILNQLTVIILHNEVLRASVTDQNLMKSILEQEKAAKNIRRQIEFTREYEKLGESFPDWINVEQLFARHQKSIGNENIRFSVRTEGLEIFADPQVDRVFGNLLDNSLRYGKKVTEIRLSSIQHLDGLTIIYKDNGVGIPSKDKNRIFQRGAGHNIGFGLFFSREILGVTGITIAETGIEGEGTRFEILVPWGRFRLQKNSDSTGSGAPDLPA